MTATGPVVTVVNVGGQVRGPDLSCFTKLAMCLNAYAINVTNLLNLLSVLALDYYFLNL